MYEKGNELWKLADPTKFGVGQPLKFDSPEKLWTACCEYFQWADDHPLKEERVGWYLGVACKTEVKKMRAYTQKALQVKLGIVRDTWQQWGKKDHMLSEVVNKVNDIIYDQKFTGAAADLLNANLIARELNLRDGTDHTSSDGSMTPRSIDVSGLSTKALKEIMKASDKAKADDSK